MRSDFVFHLCGAHVLAAADDEVGCATHHREPSVVVDGDDVAHEHPAIGREQLGVGLVVFVVARTHRRAIAGGNAFTAIAFDALTFWRVEAHVHLGNDAASSRQSMLAIVGESRTRQHAGLVGAVEVHHHGAGALFELERPRVGNGFAAGEHHA